MQPAMKRRTLPWLCCLLVLTGLSGSAAPTAAFPPPLSSTAAEMQASGPADAGTGAAAPGGTPAPAGTPSGNPDGTDPLAPTHVLSAAGPVPVGIPGSWSMVFDDEFDTLNTAIWTPYWFKDCDLTSVKNKVATCAGNVWVANGEAVLQLADAQSGALLSTNPKDGVPGHTGFEITSGYVEARIYFPGSCTFGIHNWPAWWMAGQQFPQTGETDIAEALFGRLESVYHSAGPTKQQKISGCWAADYHTYGLLRRAGVNEIYYDGELVHSYPANDGLSPQYLILNVGPTGARIFGETGAMRVDYVRAWK